MTNDIQLLISPGYVGGDCKHGSFIQTNHGYTTSIDNF